ncbi:response regulator transcription factor [Acuticoccus sediminis]|uniref:response regulator transcription factor n=1 Tax=Acuticoccus sediminis TaxID=2184697 RepID=UPI001CFE889C|nr:response regulator [Acuticoccus sediminis]
MTRIVYLVDDDPRVREALCDLLAAAGLECRAYATAQDYLANQRTLGPACLILDIELPDTNGLDLQHMVAGEEHPPIVFLTGRGDIPSSVRAMKSGAVDFLTKPVRGEVLIGAVRDALERDGIERSARAELAALEQRLATLTPREREVLPLIVSGLLNKQAAAELGISEPTLEIHRSRIMRKMAADSLPDLVRIAEKLKVPVTHSRRSGAL